jgi:hypothetical protein
MKLIKILTSLEEIDKLLICFSIMKLHQKKVFVIKTNIFFKIFFSNETGNINKATLFQFLLHNIEIPLKPPLEYGFQFVIQSISYEKDFVKQN